MKLHQVAQFASDLDRVESFYATHFEARTLGKFDPPGLLFMQVGETRVLFEKNTNSALFYFRVLDIHAEVERLRVSNVVIETEPHVIFTDVEGAFGNANEDEWMAFFRDSENNLVGLASRKPTA